MKIKKLLCLFLVLVCLLCVAAPSSYANAGKIVQGVGKVVTSVFAIPVAMVEDSTKILFPFGILTGAVKGAFRTIVGTVDGTLDIATGALPYAKYALMFI